MSIITRYHERMASVLASRRHHSICTKQGWVGGELDKSSVYANENGLSEHRAALRSQSLTTYRCAGMLGPENHSFPAAYSRS